MADKSLVIDVKADVTPLRTLSAEIRKAREEVARATIAFGVGSAEYKKASDNLKSLQTSFTNLKRSVSEAGNQVKLSKFQLAEFGENITVVSAGILAIANAAVNMGKALNTAVKEGADFGVMLSSFEKVGGDELKLALLEQASAGNLAQKELIAYTTQMSVLGVTIEQTALLLHAIEQQSDLTSVSFEQGNEAVKRFIATGQTRSLAGFMDIPALKEEVDSLAASYRTTIDKLDGMKQEQIRTQAVLNLYGGTLEDVNSSQKDNADKVATMNNLYVNLLDRLKLAVANGLVPYIKTNDDASKSINELTLKVEKSITAFMSFATFIEGIFKYTNPGYLAIESLYNLLKKGTDELLTFLGLMNQIPDIEAPKILSLDERVKGAIDTINKKVIPTINISSDQREKIKTTGSRVTEKIDTEKIDKKAIEKALRDAIRLEIFGNSTIPGEVTGKNLTANLGADYFGEMTLSEIQKAISLSSEMQKEINISELTDQASQLNSLIENTLMTLGIGTKTFVADLLSGFNIILQTIQGAFSAISIVKNILGIFSGGFIGGLPSTGGVNPNIYISSNIDGIQFFKSTYPRYINQQNYRRVV